MTVPIRSGPSSGRDSQVACSAQPRSRPTDPPATGPGQATLEVIVVHYRSRGMLLDLLGDLAGQRDVELTVHVVECGDDGSVGAALGQGAFEVVAPGENLGYCGGNNLVLRTVMDSDRPICLINPDVRIPDPTVLRRLHDALQGHPQMAAVAPSIRTAEGDIEYTGSQIDLARAWAVHTGTHVPGWPSDAPPLVGMSWIDGSCWMLRPRALRDVGLLDERFFLFSEEVDWCLRASRLGWELGVLRDVEVEHERSSSFGGSTKGTYYAWRNTFLICRKHEGYGKWVLLWLRRLLGFARQRHHLRSGETSAALRGGRDALLGRSGRMRGDA